MKYLLGLSIFLTSFSAQAQASFVYRCTFSDEINAMTSLRMKEYLDPVSQSPLGKIDLMVGQDVSESTPTQILEVPMWESDTYVKIWYAPAVRIDAVLTMHSSLRQFSAVYIKNQTRKPISCSRLSD